MSQIKVEIIPVLGDNYAYLVICEETGQAAAVDPAEADAVARRAQDLGVRIAAIWTTHHHGDHSAGNRELAGQVQLKVYGHRSERDRIPALTDAVDHEDEIELGGLKVKVLHTPGHTRGSVCYRVQDALFTGDTLFASGCGRLFEGDPSTMFSSLHEVLMPLPAETRVFCGHEYTVKNLSFAATVEGDSQDLQQRIELARGARSKGAPTVPFTLADELRTNPFLRCESEEIRRNLRGRFPDDDLTPLQVFTRLRELRNVY